MEKYLYAGARIRTLENSVIGQERLERLLACDGVDACIALLEEWGVQTVRDAGTGAFDREATLMGRLSEAYREVLTSTDGAAFARLWLMPYDCNNIKSAIKCARCGLDPDRMLITLYGGIPADTVKQAIATRTFGLLPEPFGSAAKEATEQLERAADPRVADRILDAACYAGMSAQAKAGGVALAETLVRKKIDLTNVMIALRAGRMGGSMGSRTLSEFFLPGGALALTDLLAWSAAGEDELLERLYYSGFEAFVRCAKESDRTLASLERAADDGFMETAREAKMIPVGAEIAVGYLIGREFEAKNLRILLAGKSVGLPADALRERMRRSYV